MPTPSIPNLTTLQQDAENGDQDAQHQLGRLYQSGSDDTEVDFLLAKKYYSAAAENGNMKSLCNLGLMYYNGQGVEKDAQQALKMMREAAEANVMNAQHNLAVMYTEEKGIENDIEQAIKWYTKAAEQGCIESQNNLALLYMGWMDDIPAIDYSKGLFWIDKTLEHDTKETADLIDELAIQYKYHLNDPNNPPTSKDGVVLLFTEEPNVTKEERAIIVTGLSDILQKYAPDKLNKQKRALFLLGEPLSHG